MDLELISSDSGPRSACGLPNRPAGSFLDLPKFYVFRNVTLAATGNAGAIRTDLKQVVDARWDFYLRAIAEYPLQGGSGTIANTTKIRLRWPNGRYSSNVRIPLGVFSGNGVFPKTYTPEIFIPRGGRIGIELENTNSVAQTPVFVFWGVHRVYFNG